MFAAFGPHSPEVCSEDLSCEAIVYLGLDVVVSLIGASRWNPSEPWAKIKNTYKWSSSPPKDKPSSTISTIIPSVTPSLHLGFVMFRRFTRLSGGIRRLGDMERWNVGGIHLHLDPPTVDVVTPQRCRLDPPEGAACEGREFMAKKEANMSHESHDGNWWHAINYIWIYMSYAFLLMYRVGWLLDGLLGDMCFFHFFPPCPTLAVTSGRPRVVETTWMRSVTFASVQTALTHFDGFCTDSCRIGAAIVVADHLVRFFDDW